MSTYRQYWLLSAILALATITIVEAGVLNWGMTKFPEISIQLTFFSIVGIFAWAYMIHGHSSARLLDQSERSLMLLELKLPQMGL